MAANEATCLRLAAACELEVPEAELLDVAGLPVLAVRRYDRQDSPGGHLPARVHQEDGCQATATPPGLKYEEQGGPTLSDLASLLRNFGDPDDVTSLLRRTTFSMAVGNADAHAKNLSVLHEPDSPAIRLAPWPTSSTRRWAGVSGGERRRPSWPRPWTGYSLLSRKRQEMNGFSRLSAAKPGASAVASLRRGGGRGPWPGWS
jgi:HipA-like C-terminal domain